MIHLNYLKFVIIYESIIYEISMNCIGISMNYIEKRMKLYENYLT